MTARLPTDQVIQSFSQLSIVPEEVPHYPRQKKLQTSKSRREKQQQQQHQKGQVSSVPPLPPPPDYLNVPNRTFKSMFLAASQHIVSTSDQSKIIRCWLNNSTNMQHIRAQALLLDKLLYLQLQQGLWTEYFNVGTTAEEDGGGGGVWASEVQEKLLNHRQLINDSIVISPLSFVIYYRKYIDEQLQNTEKQLTEHTNSFKSNHLLQQSKSQVQTIDLSAVAAILKALVRRGQHKLNAEFQCKKRLLHFDYEDHRLTKAFFDLKPTKKQVRQQRRIK
jgi:hypothetical protein